MSTTRLIAPVARRGRDLPAPSVAAGLSFVAASVAVAGWHVADRAPHGWWLVSFLGLVGGAAQLLLGAGHRALVRSTATTRVSSSWRQAVLWNAGALLVPTGVLADVRLAVVVGSVLLLAALGELSLELLGARSARASRAHWQFAYAALLAFLSESVVVGTALAWDLPWI